MAPPKPVVVGALDEEIAALPSMVLVLMVRRPRLKTPPPSLPLAVLFDRSAPEIFVVPPVATKRPPAVTAVLWSMDPPLEVSVALAATATPPASKLELLLVTSTLVSVSDGVSAATIEPSNTPPANSAAVLFSTTLLLTVALPPRYRPPPLLVAVSWFKMLPLRSVREEAE